MGKSFIAVPFVKNIKDVPDRRLTSPGCYEKTQVTAPITFRAQQASQRLRMRDRRHVGYDRAIRVWKGRQQLTEYVSGATRRRKWRTICLSLCKGEAILVAFLKFVSPGIVQPAVRLSPVRGEDLGEGPSKIIFPVRTLRAFCADAPDSLRSFRRAASGIPPTSRRARRAQSLLVPGSAR